MHISIKKGWNTTRMDEEAISTCLTSVLFGGTLCAIVSVENFAPRKPLYR